MERAWNMVKPGIVWLCSLLIVACASLEPQPFRPQTPDEQAIAQTMSAFLAAYRARDMATLQKLIHPEATREIVLAGTLVDREPLRANLSPDPDSPSLRAAAEHLVDFQHPTPERASVAISVEKSSDEELETTRIQWELVQQSAQWQIRTLTLATSTRQYYIRGGGP